MSDNNLTIKPVNLTELIEWVKKSEPFRSAPDTVALDVLATERDEIVLALRVLRVRRHPRCQRVRFGSYGGFEFSIRPATTDEHSAEAWVFARWMEIDDAERSLGLADGGVR